MTITPIATPEQADKFIRDLRRLRGCQACGRRFLECECVRPVPQDSVHYTRPWGWKGVMVLPETHPDHPNYKAQ